VYNDGKGMKEESGGKKVDTIAVVRNMYSVIVDKGDRY